MQTFFRDYDRHFWIFFTLLSLHLFKFRYDKPKSNDLIKLCKLLSSGVLEIDLPIADSRELHILIEHNYQTMYSEIGGYLIESLNE